MKAFEGISGGSIDLPHVYVCRSRFDTMALRQIVFQSCGCNMVAM